MGEYYTQEEFNGVKVNKIFSSDMFSISFTMMNTIDEIIDKKTNASFNIGIGGSIYGEPVTHGDVVYFGCCDKNLYAVDFDGNNLWNFETNGVVVAPCLYKNIIYFGSFDGNLYCVDLNGNMIWKCEIMDKIATKPLIYGDVIYIGAKDGNLYAISMDGEIIWKFSTRGPIHTVPFVYDDIIYFGSEDGKEYALTLDGDVKWKFSVVGRPTFAFVDASGVYFGDEQGMSVYKLDHNGNKEWSYKASGWIPRRSPACFRDIIYFPCSDNSLYALKKDGSLLWKFPTQSPIVALPCFDEKYVYLGSTDNNLYCIDQKTGKEKWKFSCGGPIVVNPTIKNGIIFVPGWDCKLYCLNTKGELLWTFPTSLSYVSKINVESTPQEVKTIQVVWNDKPKKEGEKYKEKKDDHMFSDYGSLDVGYTMNTSYIGKKKRRYG